MSDIKIEIPVSAHTPPPGSTPWYIITFNSLQFIVWLIGKPICTLLYYVAFFIFRAITFFFRPLLFLARPLILAGQFLLSCFLLPFNVLSRFENLYIYLSSASLIGLAVGALVAIMYSTICTRFQLSSKPAAGSRSTQQQNGQQTASASSSGESRKTPRSAKEYRLQKQRKQIENFALGFDLDSLPNPTYLSESGGASSAALTDSLLTGVNGTGAKVKGSGRLRTKGGRGNLLTQTILEEVDSSEYEDQDGY